jgi:hypothetical protein
MQAGASAAIERHGARRVRAAILSAAVLASLVAMPLTALAKGGAPAVTASIALASVDGAASISPHLGGSVTFTVTFPTSVKNPRIEVDCYQGSTLVFGMGGAINYAFQLGGAGSVWLSTGGSADCTATLFYFGSHAGKQTFNPLATTSFAAAA